MVEAVDIGSGLDFLFERNTVTFFQLAKNNLHDCLLLMPAGNSVKIQLIKKMGLWDAILVFRSIYCTDYM